MICEPLELEYLSGNIPSSIRDRVEVEIVDMILEKESLESIILSRKPDFVAFTGYITHVGTIKVLAGRAKALQPGVYTAVGGVHAEVVGEDFSCDEIDFIYSWNGVKGFNLTLESLLNGESRDSISAKIKSIENEPADYGLLPPDRAAVYKYRSRYYYMFHNPCALVKASYGCPYSCSFCFCREISRGGYHVRSIEDVIDELESIPEREIYIVDDDFLFGEERLLRFITLLRERKLQKRFLVYGRADFIASHPELMKELSEVGLGAVIVGIESVRSKDLSDYRKGTTKEINESCIQVLRKLGIELYATLIIPMDFSRNDFRELSAWLVEQGVTFVNLQPLTPLPGTEIFSQYKDKLLIKREDHYLWDMAHVALQPERMSVRAFYWNLLASYWRVIMRPANMIRLVKIYGIKENWRMLCGSQRVSLQYIEKFLRGK
jgi:radical SAM superfamily enzyme YgiQ (UPF0313 family)